MTDEPMSGSDGESTPLRLHRWTDRTVIGVAIASFCAGFGQFGVVAALGSVARTFGHVVHGATLADQAGLSGTKLGVGLAIIRLASLGALAATGLADRTGRRRALLSSVAAGLVLTVLAAASPGYWWFVVIFACGRPLLSATGAVAQVIAAEQTDTASRAKALALVAAGYGIGAGVTAIIHSLASNVLGFRAYFALAIIPLALVPLIARWVVEPDRFTIAHDLDAQVTPVLGAVARPYRRSLIIVATLSFAMSFVTGPANSFIFLYAQNVRHLSGAVTATMVVMAGVTGLAGLLIGRWMSDHVGRRATSALGMVGLGAFGVVAYTGSSWALVVGYVMGIMAGSIFAPAGGALINELFATSVRASASGWVLATGVLGAVAGLVTFGAIADVGNRFARAGELAFIPATLVVVLFFLLPETRGRELEDLWPEHAL